MELAAPWPAPASPPYLVASLIDSAERPSSSAIATIVGTSCLDHSAEVQDHPSTYLSSDCLSCRHPEEAVAIAISVVDPVAH